MGPHRPKSRRTSLTKPQRWWLIGNTVALAVAIALIPALSQLIVPWCLLALSGIISFALLVWGVVLFFAKEDVVGWARDLLAKPRALIGIACVLATEAAVFGALASLLPKPADPMIRLLPYGAYLTTPLKAGGLLVVEVGDAAAAFSNPNSTALYIGEGNRRVAWRISNDTKETRALVDAAKATLTYLGETKGLDRNAEVVSKDWSAVPRRIHSLRVAAKRSLRVMLCPSASTELTLYDIVGGTLRPIKTRPFVLPEGSDHTYVVMKDK
jgi:hypothetical protein